MISEQHDNHTLLIDEHDDIKGFAVFLEKIWEQFAGVNVVLDFSKYKQATLEDLLYYLMLSNNHRETGQSFVIINDALAMDDIPEELIIVPTYQEAKDIIEMEDIERDLGF